MGVMLLSVGTNTTLALGGWRIAADDLMAARGAKATLEALDVRQVEAREILSASHDQARSVGFEAGRTAGAQAAAADAATILAEAVRQLEAAEAETRVAVAALSLDIVRRVLGDLDVADLLEAAVATALAAIRQERPHTVRVSPRMAASLAVRLGDRLRVAADAALADDDCVFETAYGAVHAGVRVQLDALAQALGVSTGPEV